MPTINEYRTEFSRLHTEATAVVDAALAADRELTADEKTANETRFSRMNAIKATLGEQLRFAKLAIDGEPGATGTVHLSVDIPGRAEFEASEQGQRFDFSKQGDREAFGRALSQWAATGDMDRKFATITTATSNGALLPREIAAPIVTTIGNAFREGLTRVGARAIYSENTAEYNLPVIGIATGSDASESATSGTDNTPTPAVINLKPTTIQSGQAWVSNLELGALGFDLVSAMLPGLVDAKEQRLEQKAMAAIIADTGITQAVDVGSTTAIDYDDLVDLDSKLGKRYERQRVIILSDAAFVQAKKLKGTDGHPVLMLDPQNAQLLNFNGTPVIRSSFLEAFGTSKVIGLAVSFVGFKLRDCGQDKLVRHLNDKDKVDQTGVNLIGYSAFGYVPDAIAKLKTSAS